MKRLKEWMYDKRVTQEQLAKRVGVSQSTVSDWVLGEGNPRINRLIKLSKITGMTIDELVTYERG